jgi:hypothetical protein
MINSDTLPNDFKPADRVRNTRDGKVGTVSHWGQRDLTNRWYHVLTKDHNGEHIMALWHGSHMVPATETDATVKPSSFEQLGTEIGKLVAEKNAAYGDSFKRSGEILQILYPNGIKPEQYRDALGVVRVIDKLFRIATRKDAFGESPWRDVAGYGIVAVGSESSE